MVPRFIMVPKQLMILVFNWHLLDVIGLLQIFHFGAPSNLSQNVLIMIKHIRRLEADVTRQVPSVVGLALEGHHLFAREVD